MGCVQSDSELKIVPAPICYPTAMCHKCGKPSKLPVGTGTFTCRKCVRSVGGRSSMHDAPVIM